MFQEGSTIEYTLLVLLSLSIALPALSSRTGIPVLGILARWVRWFFIAALFTFLIEKGGISSRPQWVHMLSGLALWFLLETGYNWIAIKALSRSELPLFPSFEINHDGDEWPADNRAIDLKEWLRKNRFKRLGALKSELYEGTYLRASVYQSPDELSRLHILFLPKRKGEASACFTLTTLSKGGERIITDNHYLPYGGYYPEAWHLCRKPLIGSLPRLLKLHHNRLLRSNIEPVVMEDDPLEELNDQQRILERINTETGFLIPRSYQEEEGKISSEGRYRLWKEMWLLAYLGKPVCV
ncbi:hypothetical protein [Coraliomargarita parva]|uniref:hypothetical protein n=1 Tax=Coraliomargarita parva TaxID=3014050 RepID=UPI0022B3F531|nr:hypothetical protein [Coraliomargarita parva]